MAVHTKVMQAEYLLNFRNAARSANYLVNSSSFIELVR